MSNIKGIPGWMGKSLEKVRLGELFTYSSLFIYNHPLPPPQWSLLLKSRNSLYLSMCLSPSEQKEGVTRRGVKKKLFIVSFFLTKNIIGTPFFTNTINN